MTYQQKLRGLVDKMTDEEAEAAWLIVANTGGGNGPCHAVKQVAAALTERRRAELQVAAGV